MRRGYSAQIVRATITDRLPLGGRARIDCRWEKKGCTYQTATPKEGKIPEKSWNVSSQKEKRTGGQMKEQGVWS